MTRLAVTLSFTICLCCAGPTAHAEELSLNDAVNIALAKNTTLVNSQRTVKIFEQKVREYWATVYPSINITASYTRNLEVPAIFFNGTAIKIGQDNSYAAAASLSQIVWSGGKVGSAIKLAQLMSDQAAEQHRLNRLNIVRDVKQVYYRVQLASATAVIERDNLALAQDHLQQMNAQYAQGLRSDLTLLQQKVEVAKREPSLIRARNLSEVGLLSLKILLAQDPDTGVSLSSFFEGATTPPPALQELYARASANRPDIRIARINYDTARQQYRLARADFMPSIYANASRAFSGQSEAGWPSPDMRNWNSTAGLSLNWSFFSGGATVAQMRQAELQESQARTSAEELERDIKVQVKSAWLDLQEAQERMRSQQEAVEQARQAARSMLTRFKNGLASQLELNDAEHDLNNARLQFALAQHDACAAHAQLEWATGAID